MEYTLLLAVTGSQMMGHHGRGLLTIPCREDALRRLLAPFTIKLEYSCVKSVPRQAWNGKGEFKRLFPRAKLSEGIY